MTFQKASSTKENRLTKQVPLDIQVVLIVRYTGCSFKLQLTLAALILNYINRTGTSGMYILLGVKFVTVQSLFSGTGSYAQREIPSRKPVLLRSAAKRMRLGG